MSTKIDDEDVETKVMNEVSLNDIENVPLDDPLDIVDEVTKKNSNNKTPIVAYLNAFFLTIATVLVSFISLYIYFFSLISKR